MPTETTTSIIDALKWRYATKKFDATKKIPDNQWQLLEQALQLSPSSFGMQPYRFIVVTDQKVKEELVAACFNQQQPAQCSHFIIFARLKEVTVQHVEHYVQLIAQTRNVPAESLKMHADMMTGYVSGSTPEKLADWAAKQSYIALGNLMTVASTLKIDNCPMEGINQAEVDRILGLPAKGCHSVVACALGYRDKDCKYASLAKVRFPVSELFIKI